MKYILLLIIFSGCQDLGNQYKCVDGITYIKFNGAWVENGSFRGAKCLPEDIK